jgi:hypothetical protein
MIDNYEDLAVVRRQLTRAEDALVSLHDEVHAKNARNYAVFADAYIDMILKLRAEIDAFLEIGPPAEMPVGTISSAQDEPATAATPTSPAPKSASIPSA